MPDGRPAITGYRVRERFRDWTLLEMDLVTGRTHQIRVHLASIGHAIAGDPIYASGVARRGPDGLERLFLHSWKLEVISPTSGKLVRATAPLPDDLEPCSSASSRRISHDRRDPSARPMLVVISGPSGVGKDTILKKLKARDSASRHFVVTVRRAESRDPAKQDGIDYFFVTDDEFAERLAQDDFLETAEVYGQWSGTPPEPGRRPRSRRGKDVILKVDVQGTRSVKAKDARRGDDLRRAGVAARRCTTAVSRKTENAEQLESTLGRGARGDEAASRSSTTRVQNHVRQPRQGRRRDRADHRSWPTGSRLSADPPLTPARADGRPARGSGRGRARRSRRTDLHLSRPGDRSVAVGAG